MNQTANAPTHNGKHHAQEVLLERTLMLIVGDLLYASDTPTLIGNPYPKFTYGLNMNANWKQFRYFPII